MRKLSIILCLLMIMTMFVGCESQFLSTGVLGSSITLNQFWNGVLTDSESAVYDQTHNPQRFAQTGHEDKIECVAIKDYNVYIMYDFGNAASMSDYLMEMLQNWKNDESDVECIFTKGGIFYIVRSQCEDCCVYYASNSTLILGVGTLDDETEIKNTIQDMIDSKDAEYDSTRIQTLPLIPDVNNK